MAPETALIQLCISSGLSAWCTHKEITVSETGKGGATGEGSPAEHVHEAYLYVKGPGCGDHLKQVISHQDVTTADVEKQQTRLISDSLCWRRC